MDTPTTARGWVQRGHREAHPKVQIACYTEALRLGGDDDHAYTARGFAFKALTYHQAAFDDFSRAADPVDGSGLPSEEAAALAEVLKDPVNAGLPGGADSLSFMIHTLFMNGRLDALDAEAPSEDPPKGAGVITCLLLLLIVGGGIAAGVLVHW